MRLIPDALLMTYWVTEISLNYLLVQNVYFWMLHGDVVMKGGNAHPCAGHAGLFLVTGSLGQVRSILSSGEDQLLFSTHPCEWFDCPWNHHQYTSNRCCFSLPEHIKVCQSTYFTYLYAVYSTALHINSITAYSLYLWVVALTFILM